VAIYSVVHFFQREPTEALRSKNMKSKNETFWSI